MGRLIVAVVVAYVAMALLIMSLFAGMWFGLGPDGLLKPGSFKGNLLITIAAPSITVLGGLFGGWLCRRIAHGGSGGGEGTTRATRGRGAVMVLAGVVLVLGMVMAYFTLQKPYPADPRPAGMTVQEIMEVGREPTWVALSNPIAGAAAVLIGGLVVGVRRKGSRAG
ncbi:MAG: hypothetical protein SFY69_07340 [Planctomycetota bacterium]|nr:hypothetical protein [Planctomycetota bacterium]